MQNGVYWPKEHIELLGLRESPTYPGYGLNEVLWPDFGE